MDAATDLFAPVPHGVAVEPPHSREWSLSIPGEPVAKARPKFRRIKTATKDFVSTYTPAKTAKYEDRIAYVAQQEWKRELLRDTAIFAVVIAYRSIPSSFSKAKREAAIAERVFPITRPDWDNYGKILSDALNEVVYADDSAIVDCHVKKRYALEPRLVVTLTW